MSDWHEGFSRWRSHPLELVILTLTGAKDLALWAPMPVAPTRAEVAMNPLVLAVVPPDQPALAQRAIQQGAWDYWMQDPSASWSLCHRVALAIAHQSLIQSSGPATLPASPNQHWEQHWEQHWGQHWRQPSVLLDKSGGNDSGRDRPEQDCPEQDPSAQDCPEQDRPEQDRPEQDCPEQDPSAQDCPEQDPSAQDCPEQDPSAQDRPEQDPSAQDRPEQDPGAQDSPESDHPEPNGPHDSCVVPVGALGGTHDLCVVLDLSEQQRMAEDLRRTNRELLQVIQIKDEFLANMSHELRTPLNAILGIAEGLQEEVFGSLGDRQCHALQIVERSGNHLLALINDILDLAKIEAGQVTLNRGAVAITDLCESSLFFVRQQAQRKRIHLHIDVDDRLPLVMLDERRMRQVLINLLSNAVKFTGDRGTITLTARLAADYDGDNPRLQAVASSVAGIQFMVTDTGIGIDAENIPRLFQPFVQVDDDLDRQYTGTGLGLALVKHIVELHGGTVTVESELGVGSTLTVTVPLVAAVPVPKASAQIAPTIPTPHSTLLRPQVLLVEDNEANRMGVVDYLEMKGYSVWIAQDGEVAIALTQTQIPDLILMDVQMPKLDGIEATRRLRQDSRLDRVPILMLTALAMPGDRDRCLAAGANDYLAKPIPLKQLEHCIQHWLRSAQAIASRSQDDAETVQFEAHVDKLGTRAQDNAIQ